MLVRVLDKLNNDLDFFLGSEEVKAVQNSTAAPTSRQIAMTITQDNISHISGETVPFGGSLILDLEPNGLFTLSYGTTLLGTGMLNRHSNGDGTLVYTNPATAAARLIESQYSQYNIQISTMQNKVSIEGSNRENLPGMEKWMGNLLYSNMLTWTSPLPNSTH